VAQVTTATHATTTKAFVLIADAVSRQSTECHQVWLQQGERTTKGNTGVAINPAMQSQ
jgi:hypothetical protein